MSNLISRQIRFAPKSLLFSRHLAPVLFAMLAVFAPMAIFGQEPSQPAAAGQAVAHAAEAHGEAPHLVWALPFALLLLAIAVMPLIPKLERWWHHNSSKLIVSAALAAVTLLYYALRGRGFHEAPAGLGAGSAVLHHAVISDYFPFMVLLFSLYTISGGIRMEGKLPPTPTVNSAILLFGAMIASLIGTTGASMLLIRPLLQINAGRKNVKHTVIFFIFLVSNVGGCLLPVGDPPLFMGYLYHVPFFWTLHLFAEWAICVAALLAIYFAFESRYFRKESIAAEAAKQPIDLSSVQIGGKFNFALLAGVIIAVATLVPGKEFPGTSWVVPNLMLREWVQLSLAGLSLLLTSKAIRAANNFNFGAIAEVACLFIGIFITMQAPIELLNIKGPSLGLSTPMQFFWASGLLSSFLDNAPTYIVFFQTAGTLPPGGMPVMTGVATATGVIPVPLLIAISLGSVFMGANTYIGNGPNFMVKAIAEENGVRMPSFFGYMLWSGAILVPLFFLLSLIFFR